jgi:pyruvate/2-oxoglutarate dehydrogenase complex dihydrolipoamide dehydrogenase (E3) component
VLSGAVAVDAARVRGRAMAVVQRSRDGLARWIESTQNLTLIRAHARFAAPDTLRLDDGRELRAARVFLNVGARPIVPDWIADAGVPYLTNETILGLDEIPEHLVILGAGYISLEYAQIHRRFGARVTLIEHGERFLPREDEDTAAAVREVLEREGIVIRTGLDATALSAGDGGRGIALEVSADGGARPNASPARTCSWRSAAAEQRHARPGRGRHRGRRARRHPRRRGASHERAAHLGARRRQWPRRLHPHLVQRLRDRRCERPRRRCAPCRRTRPAYSLFTDPPLARIGMNKDAARASGRSVLVGHAPMTRVGRAVERGETDGFMEALVDAATGRLLGATLFCIEGDEPSMRCST